ncbi:hypothetical protein M413DRAFT_276588 [Hebeloma cylindrosporum]|uniref:C2H2-type domain-containing protein n=1 Tax=Hebeloma cylindrosporum TaxID=76867 RepID=A0A0C2Y8D8_HEBCY|nr:hypothetical protein M413DRAFT_276588 [Hebeloma cylindrosporum h7]
MFQHLANPLSHKARTMDCPIKSCPCKFKSGSGIAHHVENGNVHKDINRHDVTKAVKAFDTNNTISITRNITSSSNSPPSSTFLYTATEDAFDGRRYVCFLCSKEKFKTLHALNSHLNSPAHDANEFKCPICEKEFKVVSALAQHVEASGCAMRRIAGVDGTSAEDVERYIDNLTSRFTSKNRIEM